MSLFTKVFSARKISQGFTLVELIIVIIVIGILASVGVAQYAGVVRRAKNSEAKSVLGAMRRSQMAYKAEHEAYVIVATCTGLDITIPVSDYFTYTCHTAGGLVKAAAKTDTGLSNISLAIDGTWGTFE